MVLMAGMNECTMAFFLFFLFKRFDTPVLFGRMEWKGGIVGFFDITYRSTPVSQFRHLRFHDFELVYESFMVREHAPLDRVTLTAIGEKTRPKMQQQDLILRVVSKRPIHASNLRNSDNHTHTIVPPPVRSGPV